jgi:hypothetical protein
MNPVVGFAAVVMLSLGRENSTRLNTLKTSARNYRLNRFFIGVIFAREKSKLLMPGPRSDGSVALSFPNV